MGSVQSFETPKRWGGRPGKIDAPLNKKLSEVKWGDFRIGDLFEVRPTKSYGLTNTKLFATAGDTPVVTNTGANNGVSGRVALPPTEKGGIITYSDTTTSDAIFYQSEDFIGYSHVQGLYPKQTVWNRFRLLYFVAAFKKAAANKFDYGNKFNRAITTEMYVTLPVTINSEIDFEFIDNFIVELEAQRIVELEAYLTVAGLKNYELTDEEHKALEDYDSLSFKNYSVPKLFEIKNTGNILSKDIVKNSGEYPYLCASADNNAVSTYISYDKKYMDKGNCIFIGGKTFVVTYQEKDFFSNDSHNLTLRLKDELKRCKDIQLYMATCINKSLGHRYSWGDSISNKKIRNDIISLPSLGEFIDYDSMPILISAIKKLVIRDVVLFADRKIEAAKEIVNK